MKKTFGEMVQAYRREKGWTVKEFIVRLGNDVSPAYITKIEVHGETPSPELMCKIAAALDVDIKVLLEAVREEKFEQFRESFDKKYQAGIALYRLQKK